MTDLSFSLHFTTAPASNLYRVKPRWRECWLPDGSPQSVPPATEALQEIGNNGLLGSNHVFKLPWRWVEYFKSLNPETYRKIFVPWAGVFNAMRSIPDWYDLRIEPQYNVCAFDFNVVNVTRIVGNAAYIETMNAADEPPVQTGKDHLRHQFYSITPAGEPRLLGAGYVVFVPLVTARPCGLPLELLERVT